MKKLFGWNLLKPAIYLLGLFSVFLLLISSIDMPVSWLVEDIIDVHYDPRPKSMEMHLRKLRMLQTCKKYGSVLRAPEMLSKRNTLIWDLKDQLIYCRIAKVASSTWTTNMLRLDSTFNSDLPESKRWLKEFGARENEAFRKYPVPKTEPERRSALVSGTKFLVVRHPLDRLVSSYLDKVADTSKEPNLLKHRDVKNAILANSGKKPELGVVPTFPEFIDYVVKETSGLSSPRDWKGVMTWKSYFSKCLPCDVKYDVIMKLETHKEDEKWLINTKNLTLLSRVRDWRHLSSDKNIRKNLISQLSKAQLNAIYTNYQVDFEMFNYTMNKYLK
eukprot:TRINITY_DN12441_c0_g1_i1.p1 TRINITY_DN12441_c0_g1~~TRINITY_DN12441_c0_g1_i1.p1  ORF type:complete len:331 (-),score=90.24 TRINITY_DN12441_c0_g1_i1:93-1085(-)